MTKIMSAMICVSAILLTACGSGSSEGKVLDSQKPVFTSPATAEVFENQSNAITLLATDASSVTYTIREGDSQLLSIDSTTGMVWFNTLPEFSTRSVYSFTAIATDVAGNAATQDITITIKAVIGAYKLKKTGQTKSYNEQGIEVKDDTLKDDGYYQEGVATSYSREGDIVTDNITHLKWYDSNESYNKKTSPDAQKYCENLTVDGGKWRLPNVDELMNIVDRGETDPSVDAEFKNITSTDYWTSTDYLYDNSRENKALIVNFEFGYDAPFSKTGYAAYILCVKGSL